MVSAVSALLFLFSFLQSGGASRLRICYEGGLPDLVNSVIPSYFSSKSSCLYDQVAEVEQGFTSVTEGVCICIGAKPPLHFSFFKLQHS